MAERVGVVVFPGTNCEHDVVEAFEELGAAAELVWHGASVAGGLDAVVLPGGFAHGDYLRPGAIARFSPVMGAVAEFAAAGGPVVGICNGFQVLTEAHLLPGALQKNKGLTFVCQMTELEVTSDRSALTAGVEVGRRLRYPSTISRVTTRPRPACSMPWRTKGRVVLRYVANPNGSAHDIAGVCNESGNVVGLMPHPERASSDLLGSTDGLVLLARFVGLGGCTPGTGRAGELRHRINAGPHRRAPRPGRRRTGMASPLCCTASLGLTDEEAESIERLLGRPPTISNWPCTPSCGASTARTSRLACHLRRLPTEGPEVLVGPGENAGVIDAGDGIAVAIRIESHNHPSAIEPYQGAATGVGRHHPRHLHHGRPARRPHGPAALRAARATPATGGSPPAW